MAEELNVRLVRCPKCECLIPEFPQYSVYRCGSCDVVLKAKKKEPVGNEFKDKSDDESKRGNYQKVNLQFEKDGSPRTARVEGLSRRKERTFAENVSSSKDKEKKAFLDDDKRVMDHRQNHDRAEKGDDVVDNHIASSNNPINYWAQSDDQDMNMNRSKSINSSKVEAYSPKVANFARSSRLKGVERDDFGGSYRRNLGTIYEQNRVLPLHYPDEGPSNYRCSSVHGYHKTLKSFEYLDVPNGDQNFVNGGAQLLTKLDEVKDQLGRSQDNKKKAAFTDPLGGSVGKRTSAHYMFAQYPHVSDLAYLNHSSRYDGTHVQKSHGNFLSALKHVHHHGPEYGHSLPTSVHRRVYRNPPQQRTYGCTLRQHADFDDLFASHPSQETNLYPHPFCSCLHCRESPSQVPHAGFNNRRLLKDPFSSTFRDYANSNTIGQHYLPRAAKFHKPDFHDPAAHIWPSDISSDIDGFSRSYPRRVVLTSRNKRLCHPIARGAPFITCYKCMELLKLPRNFRKMMKNDQKVLCGACSTLIVLEMKKKSPIITVHGNPKQRYTEGEEKSSKEDESPDNVIDWRDSPYSSGLSISYDVSREVLSSKEEFNNISPNKAMRVHRNRNRTNPANSEKVVLLKSASQVVSEKNTAATTKEEGILKGYLSAGSYQDSFDSSKEGQLKVHKGSKTFLVGLIKKSFRDLSRSNNNSKTDSEIPNILVNGQPISEHAVRKAERRAGPIHPGNYWYDHRAGFWGVIGHPCSGIIPPFIKEFNYPMTENCAAGNTGVFVNGRELHQKDLGILACKGLPTTRDKSYCVEFNGNVLDEGNGIQLFNLGKLAPTVEKEKCGFGMLVPGVVE